jgi:hypothetical protein
MTPLAVVGLTLALAGCSAAILPGDASTSTVNPAAGKPAAPSAHADAAAPCTLVTEAEAGVALGTDPGPGVTTDQGAEHQCTYGNYPTAIVVASTPTNGKFTYEAATNVQGKNDGAFDIPGLGTEAFGLTPATDAGSAAYFYKGDAYVSITLVLASAQAGSPAPEVLVLAKAAAGRL